MKTKPSLLTNIAIGIALISCSSDEPTTPAPLPTEPEPNRVIEGFGRVADAVDLGLSVKWASWNVGASDIADYGGLYGAGDPTGLATEKNDDLYAFEVNTCICGTQSDLAHVLWGENWRMPTASELQELRQSCSWDFSVEIDGTKGCTATGPNGNKIFIPYAGYRDLDFVSSRGNMTSLWSGDAIIYRGSYHGYKDFDIYSSGRFADDGSSAWNGQSIRPVCN